MLRTRWTSLQNKLTLSLAVLAMAIVACSAFFAIQRERGRSLLELEKRATLLAEFLGSSLAEPLWNVDVKAINDQLGALAVDSEVAEVAVMALNFGRVATRSGPGAGIAADRIQRSRPIKYIAPTGQEHTIGEIQVALSRAVSDATIARFSRDVLIAAGGGVTLVCGAFFILLRRMVGRPVKRLERMVDRIAAGDLTARCPVDSRDELGRLGARFNTMADRVEERETKIRRLVDANIIGVFTWHIPRHGPERDQGIFVELNDAFLQMLGYDRDDFPSDRMRQSDLTPPEWRDRDIRTVAELREHGVSQASEKEFLRKDGSRIPVLIGSACFDKTRTHGVAFVVDLTELRQAEQELRASEERFRAFVDNATDAFFLFDDRAVVLDVNHQACESLGYRREELIGKHPRDFNADFDAASRERLSQRMLAGETVSFEARHRRKDGTTFPVEVRISHFKQGDRRYLSLARDITERKRAEDELRASEERFRTLVQFSFDVYYEIDAQYRYVRREFPQSVADEQPPIGTMPWETPYLEPGAEAWRKVRETMDARLPVRDFEVTRLTPGGVKRCMSVSALPVFDKTGQFIGYRGVGRDITERKTAEEALRRSEAYLAGAQELSHSGAFAHNLKENLYWSEGLYRIWEFDPSQGMPSREACFERILPEDRDRVRRVVEEAVRQKQDYSIEYRITLPGGALKHLRSICHPSYSVAGELVEVVGTAIDVTEHKRAEQALRRSEAYLAEAQKISHSGAFAYIVKESLYWSEELFRIWGFDQLQGIPSHEACWERVHPDDRNRTREQLKEALREKRHYTSEFRIVLPDGTLKHLRSIGHPSYSLTGELVEVVGTTIDVTESKRAEETLRRSEAYLAEAQRLSNSGAYAFDANGTLYWSEGMYTIWGFDPAEGIPSRAWHRVHPDDRNRFNEQVPEALREKRDFSIEFRIVLPDGTLKYVQSIGHPSYSGAGEFIEVVGITMDVTERKRTEQEHERLRQLEADLAHLNRLSVMGELTASLAHEILHPIATARNNARAGMRFLELSPPNLGEVIEALACVVKDADRAKDIVDRIRDHIKKAPARDELFDLNQAIGEVIVMVRHAIEKDRVLVQTRLKEGMISVRGDRVQLQQVVLNLILNGVEAMSSVEEGPRQLSISTELNDNNGVIIAVRDSGPGIDPEHLDLVFKPFHTTKPSGMGMGLAICQSIIAAHGGRLWAETNRDRGAIFQFTLPSGLENS